MNEAYLKRPIKDGKKYEKYFGAQCETRFLGNGNTDLSISLMSDWVNKYKDQCKDLALNEFANLSLPDTVTAIYNFLHDHFQYKLDGSNQKIRSPYCSWLERRSGIDCKSYSVLASCILSMLGIRHFLRKTKQPGFNSDSYTHVYVVIPTNQKAKTVNGDYYIIDATIHNNFELPFIEAKDKLMSKVGLPHYGLGFPGSEQGSCSCTDNMQPLGVPVAVLPQAIENFKKFLLKLEQRGVSRSQTQDALNRLKDALENGKDPKMKDLFQTETSLGLGLLSFPGLSGADDEETTNEEGEVEWLDTVMEEASSSGWFQSTFGSVFGNGWNFSCWGTSYSPAEAKNVTQQKIQQHANMLGNPPTQESFDKWNNSIAIAIGAPTVSSNQGNLASCTRDGFALEKQIMQEYKNKTINALKNAGYQLVERQKNVLALTLTHNEFLDNWIRQNSWAFKYTTYDLVLPVNNPGDVIVNYPDGSTNGGSSGSGGSGSSGSGGSGSGGDYSKASTGMIAGIVLLGLVAGNYFYKKKSK